MVCMVFRFELKWLLYGMEWENPAHPARVEGDRARRVSYSSWLKPTPTRTGPRQFIRPDGVVRGKHIDSGFHLGLLTTGACRMNLAHSKLLAHLKEI